MSSKESFPANFLWGAAISAHQVEGCNKNNWSEWEIKNAEKLAHEAAYRYQRLERWNDIKKLATSVQNYISGHASDHYHSYKKDFDILKSLGANSCRISIEWSRIEPNAGQINDREIKHYHDVVDELISKNIEPILTLWHWTHPIWFERMGGFEKRANVKHFVEYASIITKEFTGKVKYFVILNEPEVYAQKGYLFSDWPPQKKSYCKFVKVVLNLLTAHRQVYNVLKRHNDSANVGIAKHNCYYIPKQNNIINWMIVSIVKYWANQFIINAISSHLDFIGLNFYFVRRIGLGKDLNQKKNYNDMGWELEPGGIYHCLMELKKYRKPIIITENGLADEKDKYRSWYIEKIVLNMKRAMKDGVNLKGYLHWSLLDNFEWDSGFWPRFGLVAVDYHTQKRTIRKSAFIYAKIIQKEKNNEKIH